VEAKASAGAMLDGAGGPGGGGRGGAGPGAVEAGAIVDGRRRGGACHQRAGAAAQI
jgi:hypothetical protein